MTIEQFRKVQRAQPFRPYELKLAGGRAVRVSSPEFVTESRSGQTLAVWIDDGFEIIDLPLVAEVEELQGPPK